MMNRLRWYRFMIEHSSKARAKAYKQAKKACLVVWLVVCLLVGIVIGLQINEHKASEKYHGGILRAEACILDGGVIIIDRQGNDFCIYD